VSSSSVHETKIERKSEREKGRWRERERGRERDWWKARSRAPVAGSGLGHWRSGPRCGQEQWNGVLCPPEKAEREEEVQREERESEVKGRAELGGGEAQGGGVHHGAFPVPSKRRRAARKSRGREAARWWQGKGEEERELERGVTRA
jgi:hypothetical protein